MGGIRNAWMILTGMAVVAMWPPTFARGQNHGRIAGEVVRVIDDGATGDRWVLMHNGADRGGPGRMMRIERADTGSMDGARSKPAQGSAERPAHAAANSAMHPVIRAGEAVVVEEHSEVVDARLEATALGSAAAGDEFYARLKIGGEAVRVKALGPGRASLVPEPGAHP